VKFKADFSHHRRGLVFSDWSSKSGAFVCSTSLWLISNWLLCCLGTVEYGWLFLVK